MKFDLIDYVSAAPVRRRHAVTRRVRGGQAAECSGTHQANVTPSRSPALTSRTVGYHFREGK